MNEKFIKKGFNEYCKILELKPPIDRKDRESCLKLTELCYGLFVSLGYYVEINKDDVFNLVDISTGKVVTVFNMRLASSYNSDRDFGIVRYFIKFCVLMIIVSLETNIKEYMYYFKEFLLFYEELLSKTGYTVVITESNTVCLLNNKTQECIERYKIRRV